MLLVDGRVESNGVPLPLTHHSSRKLVKQKCKIKILLTLNFKSRAQKAVDFKKTLQIVLH